MENELYDYSPITERPPIAWPGGKKLAFYVGLNIEHFRVDILPPGSFASSAPDPLTFGPRDYGNRVGIWRMIDLFDEVGVRPSAITNSEVLSRYPQIIEAGLERNWTWVAHGLTNSIKHSGLSETDEVAVLDEIVAAFAARGITPKGWLGPSLTETFATPRLLRDRGFEYLLDWIVDDRPFATNIPGLLSVPYTQAINDITVFATNSLTGGGYEEMVLDQFEVLLGEGGGVLALPVHPFVTGQPGRFKHLAAAVRAITAHPDVWVTTAEEIAAYCR
jgi:allantoinase